MYNEDLANRIREALTDIENVTEKKMFQGLSFLVNKKLCVSVRNNEIICRIPFENMDEELEKEFCRPMIHNGKIMKGYIFVAEKGYIHKKDFDYYINLCLENNKLLK